MIDLERYRRDGFFFPYRLMSPIQADDYAARFISFTASDAAKAYPDPVNQLYLLKAHLIFKWADEIAHHPRLLDAVEQFIGGDIMIWSSGVFAKPAHSGAHVSWHQDATNYELDSADGVVRAWVALTPATLQNGTMHFLPGAHVHGQISHVDRKADGELLSRGETIDLTIDEAATVPVLIDAGEVSFHHLHAPHGSGRNNSDRPRVNYVITYITPERQPRVGPDCAMLARGHDRFGHFEHEPRPDADFSPDAMRAHKKYLTMRNAILFRGTAPPAPPNHPV